MNISFASIMPHPLSVIPSITLSSDLKRITKTIKAMDQLSEEIKLLDVDVVVIITPQIPINYTSFSIIESPVMKGSFIKFGDQKTKIKVKGHPEMATEIKKSCAKERIPLSSFDDPELDHGTVIPLYYIVKNNPEIKIVPLGISGLSVAEHFNFGKAIGQAIDLSGLKVAVVASSNLSRKLSPGSSTGYSPKGKELDQLILKLVKKGDTKAMMKIDSESLKDSGESGYLPMIVLFGILDDSLWKGEILSYERPFGTGLMTVKIDIAEK